MAKTRVLIVEDELIVAEHIAESLADMGYEVLEPVISYREAIEAIETHNPDFAILDIQLSGKRTGVELAAEINDKYRFPFIFLTSNSDKVTLNEAKMVEPYAFLVKPFSEKELYASVELALFNFSRQQAKSLDRRNLIIRDALFIKQGKTYSRLDFKDILYVQSDHVYLDVVQIDGKKTTVRGTLNDYMEKLGTGFIQCHRSCLINVQHLRGLDHSTVWVLDQEVPLGRRYREKILGLVNKG